MVWFASPLAGYLCDRFGCRITCFLGSTLCISGLVSTSYVHSLTMMYSTYSALYGLGTCLIYNPCFLVISKYFTYKLSVATGVVSLGASVGILYTGPLLQVLLDSFDWRNTFRIMAATYVFVSLLSLTFNPYVEETTIEEKFNSEEDDKEEIRNEKTGISLYCSVWRFPAYTFIVTSFMFASFGMYIPYINLVSSPLNSYLLVITKMDEVTITQKFPRGPSSLYKGPCTTHASHSLQALARMV